MKLVNYKLQAQIEQLSLSKSNKFFKEYLTSILEDTSKPYYTRADYIGLSLNELKDKIDYLSHDIQELQAYKKKLSLSLDIAKEITADVLVNNGIDRIDGTIISSITLSKPTTKTKESIEILDAKEVMRLGYVKFEPDMDSIQKALKTKEGQDELDGLIKISSKTTATPSKVKINTKRTAFNTQADELLSIVDKAA